MDIRVLVTPYLLEFASHLNLVHFAFVSGIGLDCCPHFRGSLNQMRAAIWGETVDWIT
jgi:hypothetical protein